MLNWQINLGRFDSVMKSPIELQDILSSLIRRNMVGHTIFSSFWCGSLRLSHLRTSHLTSYLVLKYIPATLTSLLFLQLNWQVFSAQNSPSHPHPDSCIACSLASFKYLHKCHHLIESTLTTLFKIAVASTPSS